MGSGTIIIPSFAGEVPAVTPRLLDNMQAAKAINCQLERGHLEPLAGPGKIAGLRKSARTIYRHPQDGWLEWEKDVSVVKSAVYDMAGEKPLGHLFITGDRPYPTQYLAGGEVWRLGLPRPEIAPVIAIESGALAGTVECFAWGSESGLRYPPKRGCEDAMSHIEPENADIEALAQAHADEGEEEGQDPIDIGIQRSSSYCYTLVQTLADGIIRQESPPSAPTEIIDVPDGDGVRISGFAIPELPETNITHIRIYRTLSGNESSEFHFLIELELPVEYWIDAIADQDVPSEVLQTATWDAIPDDAQGLIVTNNGIYAAFHGNELLISEPGYAYVFPEYYRLTVEDNIVALAHVDNTIIVLTEGRPYLATGTEPAQMQLTHLPIEQSCVAANSVATLPGGVIYASPDGLMVFTANDQSLASSQTFTREQWRQFPLADLLGAMLDGKYLAFFAGTNQGFIFVTGSKDIVRIELPEEMKIRGLCHHSGDDCVYLSIDSGQEHAVWKWEGGEKLEYVWKSKPFFTSRLLAMTAVRVEGSQSAKQKAALRLYCGDRERPAQSLNIADTKTKRIAAASASKEWSIELRGKAEVWEVRLGTGVEDLENGY